MPNSHRIRTQLGVDKVLQINLDQDYDTLELLSFSFFPNDVYTRTCADFGVVCGRVFCNRGLGLVNARVSIFIPISSEDESNPIISTLYPYKSFLDFNEDGYKYNLLPYSPSHSGHVPVGTFPDRLDALTNQTVVEVYDKYYKFTAKTNDAGDFMIFGVPVGQYDLFMQVDLSDIGEFSLTPQDLIRMGRATEAQVAGTKFKFSENYSELPQIVTLTKVIQIAPFYGQDGICQHYITRADFDLTTESSIEIQPTAVFMGSLISTEDRKRLKRRCRVPAKQGFLCNLTTGPGQIEAIRQTIQTDELGRPILEQLRLQNDGKLIDENGTWVIELPMNVDYVYTDEFGNRVISPDGSVGVPVRGRYRFRIKWQQSNFLSEETKRGYFLVPNIKEHGWPEDPFLEPDDPGLADNITVYEAELTPPPSNDPDDPPSSGPFEVTLNLPDNSGFYNVLSTTNIQDYVILVDGQERRDLNDTIPLGLLTNSVVGIRWTVIDATQLGILRVELLDDRQYKIQSSYTFSVSWADYGTPEMIQEAINCEDRFYEFQYNKVYTVSQLIDRYSNRIFPQKSIQIKHILDDKCEGDFNPFPTNDVYYRYDLLYITVNVILTIMKFQFFQILYFLHVLAFLWPIIAALLILVWAIQKLVYWICLGLQKLSWRDRECNEPRPLRDLIKNPFKDIKLPLFLYTEDGCERCRCKIDPQELDEENNGVLFDVFENLEQIDEKNISYLANFATITGYRPWNNNLSTATLDPFYLTQDPTYDEPINVMLGGNAASEIEYRRLPIWAGNDGNGKNVRVFSTSLTIAERINLFNTKAKYFDNLTTNAPGDNPTAQRLNSLSPGDVGWNLIRVTFDTERNDVNGPNQRYHFDNVIVLLTDEEFFGPGDVLTFQDPGMSNDPHVLTTTGVCLNPSVITVNYANPNTDVNQSPTLTTFYDMGEYPVESYVAPDGTIKNKPVRNKQVCFPMDIEYFQVIQEMSYNEYFDNTSTAVPQAESAKRFSLPWRFLRQQTGYDLNNGAFLKNITSNDFGTPNMGNGQWVYREVSASRDNFGGVGGASFDGCYGTCFYQTTHITNNLNSIRSYFPYSQTSSEYVTFGQPDPRLRVVFLVRGVDIYAPKMTIRYDLRRLFGLTSSWDSVPRIDHINPAIGPQYDISDFSIVEGRFYPNIPIQPGGQQQFGFNTQETCGWRLYGIYLGVDAEGGPLIDSTNRFLAVIRDNGNFDGGPDTAQLAPLSEIESGPYEDETNIFEDGLLTAPLTNNYFINVFLKYQGSVAVNGGLVVFLRDFTDGVNINIATLDVTTGIEYFSTEQSVSLTEGHQYRLLVTKTFNGTITFYADLFDWVTSNPHGLKLPKHNEFIENSPTPPNGSTGNIFFSSQFFRIPQVNFTAFTSTMANYYSALDENAIFWSNGPSSWRSIYQNNINANGISYDGIFGYTNGATVITFNSDDIINNNHFTTVLLPTRIDGAPIIPCMISNIIGSPWDFCGTEPSAGNIIVDGICSCDGEGGGPNNSRTSDGCPGCCRFRFDLRYRNFVYHQRVTASEFNEVGSYWGKEYVEGGSAFSLKVVQYEDYYEIVYSTDRNCEYSGDNGGEWRYESGRCHQPDNVCVTEPRQIIPAGQTQQYISPCYANFPNVDPSPEFAAFFGGDIEEARKTWYVNPNHEIQMNYSSMNVFRTDRLPSSTTPQGDGNGNGYLLHQNNGFSIFKIDVENCTYELAGGGTIPNPVQSAEVDFDNLPDDGAYTAVAESLSNCALAVDLNSYYINGSGYPAIKIPNPYSREPATLGSDWIWFNRGTGCYSIVSKPLASLFPHKIDGDPDNKFYWDVATIVEWIQRLKLTFAQCFEIFSHTFSNNWVNGTLYAFSFQNATRFNSQNLPVRYFCKDVIYFHDPTNTYYYRSSPWNGGNFVGQNRDLGRRGNIRNLLYPTTILDMGPKASFIQEIVLSDDYDGYIVNKIPTTSFKTVTDILNLFILNRLVNTNFIQKLIPLPNDADGNEEGSDDPSIGAMFANTRWANGESFFGNLLPGLIDGDYSQLISINSEFGVNGYSPDNYTSKDVWFGEDEGNGLIIGRYLNRIYDTKRPVLGIFFSGDNQMRDYISPRRTILFGNSANNIQTNFIQISTKTQVVPFYQWNIFHDRSDPEEGPSIFGTQSNNFITEYVSGIYTNNPNFPFGFFSHGYQSLDRFGESSEYFNPDGNNSFVYKGYIINYYENLDEDGNVTGYTPTYSAQTSPRYRYTFGAPFHFYFGLKQGASAMDRFTTLYVDTTEIYE